MFSDTNAVDFGERVDQEQRDSHATSVSLSDALLLIYADLVDDFEHVRIGMEGRVRSLRQIKNLEGTPVDLELQELVNDLIGLENKSILKLQKQMKAHPLGQWVKNQKGVGEKQAARLLGVIGDPASRKNFRSLWAYCGYNTINGIAPKRARGVSINWNPRARMRTYLIAKSCIKQLRGPCSKDETGLVTHVDGVCKCGSYRTVYDGARKHYASFDISDLHKHNRALRLVSKTILKDLWMAAHQLKNQEQEEEGK